MRRAAVLARCRESDSGGTLTAGAKAGIASGVKRVIWLGALGTGPSAAATRLLSRIALDVLMRSELPDKLTADATVIAASGTVFHVGPMSHGQPSADLRTVTLDQFLDEFMSAPHWSGVLCPLR